MQMDFHRIKTNACFEPISYNISLLTVTNTSTQRVKTNTSLSSTNEQIGLKITHIIGQKSKISTRDLPKHTRVNSNSQDLAREKRLTTILHTAMCLDISSLKYSSSKFRKLSNHVESSKWRIQNGMINL